MKTSESDARDWFRMAADRLRVADSAREHEGITFSGIGADLKTPQVLRDARWPGDGPDVGIGRRVIRAIRAIRDKASSQQEGIGFSERRH